MKKVLIFLCSIVFIIFNFYIFYYRYEIIISKKQGSHFLIDGENKCYINYEYQCPNVDCSNFYKSEFPYYNAYFTDLFDAVRYAENNYKIFYNKVPAYLKVKYKEYFDKRYIINSICEKNDDENIYGYGVTFGGYHLYNFYTEYNEYIKNKLKLYTFEEMFSDLKNKQKKQR